MLTYQKTKLLNLALQLELAINDIIAADEREDAAISEQMEYKKDNDAFKTLDRNIQSIKKTIKRL